MPVLRRPLPNISVLNKAGEEAICLYEVGAVVDIADLVTGSWFAGKLCSVLVSFVVSR